MTNAKTQVTCERYIIDTKYVLITIMQETMVALLTGDVISGLGPLLATEIEKPPLLTGEKLHLTCERYTLDSKLVSSTNMKPWSLYRLVTSLPVSGANELVKERHKCKSG
jgi:hypothetical protein